MVLGLHKACNSQGITFLIPPWAEIQGTVHPGIQLLQDGAPDRDSGRQGQTLSAVPSP